MRVEFAAEAVEHQVHRDEIRSLDVPMRLLGDQRQVDAVGENEATMGQLVKLNASLDVDKKFRITQQVNGIAVRKGQFELLQWVNTFVGYTARNGELDGIYRKWLNEPLPDELK